MPEKLCPLFHGEYLLGQTVPGEPGLGICATSSKHPLPRVCQARQVIFFIDCWPPMDRRVPGEQDRDASHSSSMNGLPMDDQVMGSQDRESA